MCTATMERARFRQAVEEGRIGKMERLIEEIREPHPRVAEQLENLAEHHELELLLKVV